MEPAAKPLEGQSAVQRETHALFEALGGSRANVDDHNYFLHEHSQGTESLKASSTQERFLRFL